MKLTAYMHETGKTELSLKEIQENLDSKKHVLRKIPIDVLVEMLTKLGKNITKDKKLLSNEGVFYLASWLRKSNLSEYLDINYADKRMLDEHVKLRDKHYVKAQPRGLVCHWIAGNVPTLAAFSLIQSILCKNTNILKIPEPSLDDMVCIIEKLANVEVEQNGVSYNGIDILSTIAFVVFSHEQTEIAEEFSSIADCNVVWGGREAVEGVLALPQREHCETVVLGPKYSFAVIDEESLGSHAGEVFNNLVKDVITFDQAACSSPHVLFYERTRDDSLSISDVAEKLRDAFIEQSKKHPKVSKNPSVLAKIINKRGEYYLSPEKNVFSSDELDWTILIDDKLQLEEPLSSRTLFLKQVASVFDIVPLVTHKIQTVGALLSNKSKLLELSDQLSYNGVSRIVPFGEMNDYDTPWDGLLFMNRLSRFCSTRIKED